MVFSVPHSPNYTGSPGTLFSRVVASAKGYVQEHRTLFCILTKRAYFFRCTGSSSSPKRQFLQFLNQNEHCSGGLGQGPARTRDLSACPCTPHLFRPLQTKKNPSHTGALWGPETGKWLGRSQGSPATPAPGLCLGSARAVGVQPLAHWALPHPPAHSVIVAWRTLGKHPQTSA